MRRFIDFHIKAPEDTGTLQSMLELGSKLGFKGLGIVAIGKISDSIKKDASELGVDLVSRVNLKPRNTRELTSTLSKIRRRFEIIAVDCRSKEVARQAAKDKRVDVLNFPSSYPDRKKVWFDRQEASLASGANCAYETNLSDILGKGPIVASGLLSIMRDEVENANRCNVPIVVSSGAAAPLLMRDPRGLAAILCLLGMEEMEGLDAVSTNPWRLVEMNRGKLGREFVAPGVRVL